MCSCLPVSTPRAAHRLSHHPHKGPHIHPHFQASSLTPSLAPPPPPQVPSSPASPNAGPGAPEHSQPMSPSPSLTPTAHAHGCTFSSPAHRSLHSLSLGQSGLCDVQITSCRLSVKSLQWSPCAPSKAPTYVVVQASPAMVWPHGFSLSPASWPGGICVNHAFHSGALTSGASLILEA